MVSKCFNMIFKMFHYVLICFNGFNVSKKRNGFAPPAVDEAPRDGAHGIAAALGLRHGGGLPWAAAGGPGESPGEARAWWCLVGGWWGWWMVVDFWRVVEVTFSKISQADLLLDVGLDLSRRVIFR